MMKLSTFALTVLAASSLPCLGAFAQSLPAGVGSAPNVGFQIPQLSGSFNYALSASELFSTGFYNSGSSETTNFSGDVSYLSGSTRHPFSAIYSGGILVANSGQPTSVYQSVALSQSYNTRVWNFSIADSISYLPESPVSGLSGIPGVGDLGIDPVPLGPDAGIGILTNYGPRVTNTVTGSVSRVLSGHLSAQASGYENIQRFIGSSSPASVDNSGEGGTAGVSYHVDARSSVSLNYSYTRFNFLGSAYAIDSQSGTVNYSRQWTRRFGSSVYVGPQYISNAGTSSTGTPFNGASFGMPSTQIAAGASLTYDGRSAFYSVSYARGTNNGSGVTTGAFSDSITAGAHRQIGRQWSVSGNLGFARSISLPSLTLYNFSFDSVTVGGQVVRGFGRRFSAYGSYVLEEQSSTGAAPTISLLNGGVVPVAPNAFSGTYNIFGIGVTYSPGSLFLSR